ncbi:preATP grasp domain-containing protein [Paenibacillus hexagrammi]|uniref:Peptide ligase PGM1-related protein n=1 Tax=Paenibacillus hexagrammi TaxID=2908839 RepID=A0ABY3SKV3_9BACL|nr:peptide ligase PGM1-related protein [Paenibacillus sp. YPD9-1]UJF34502.1 peptide ligase PGM1-related protein [Paenibacillus sp. YPD9-1]
MTFHLIHYVTTQRGEGTLIWMLNIGAEKYWNRVQAGINDPNENRLVNRVEEMNILLCREQDILILREQPDAAFISRMREYGFSIPRILTPSQADPLTPIAELVLQDSALMEQLKILADSREDVCFVPYAVTALEEQIAEACGLRMMGASSVLHASVNDKIMNRRMAEELGFPITEGKVCTSIEEIREAYERLTAEAPFFTKVIIKEPHGASGKGLYIVDHESKLAPLLSRFSRVLRSSPDSQWIVEGWHEKSADVNYQIYVAPDGTVDVFSIKQQILRETVYIGSKMPPTLSEGILQAYHEYGQKIGAYLYALGYTGIAGIDSIITSEGTIVPIIEINGRFTLSTYISFLQGVLGESKVFSRYFRVHSDRQINYQELCALLDHTGILYDSSRGEGVILYTAGSLPIHRDESSSTYTGRMFALIVSQDWQTNERIHTQLEKIVDDLAHTNRNVMNVHLAGEKEAAQA